MPSARAVRDRAASNLQLQLAYKYAAVVTQCNGNVDMQTAMIQSQYPVTVKTVKT